MSAKSNKKNEQAQTKHSRTEKPSKKRSNSVSVAQPTRPKRRLHHFQTIQNQQCDIQLDELIEDKNRAFLKQHEETLPQLKTELTVLQQRRKISLSKVHKLQHDIKVIEQCREVVIYNLRLAQLLHIFFDRAVVPDVPECMFKFVAQALVAMDEWQNEWAEKENFLPSADMKNSVKETLLVLSQILLRYQHELFPHSNESRLESIRVLARPIPIIHKTLEDVYIWWFCPEKNTLVMIQKEICEFCHSGLLLQRKDSMQTCKCSARTYQFFNMIAAHSDYKNDHVTPPHDYKRSQFIQRWLSQFKQGSRKIEPEVLMMVKRELLNRQITSKFDVRMTTVKSVLSSLGLQAYINHPAKIANILNDIPIAEFTEEQFKEILERAKAVEEVHIYLKRHVQDHNIKRVNYPSLTYFVRQCCLINRWHNLTRRFRLHKLEDSRDRQEDEWKIYIKYLKKPEFDGLKHRWVFIRTK